MTSYNIEVLLCSKCESEFVFWNVGSCNTFNAIFFTDGSIFAPMYDPGELLIGCPSCDYVFWPDEKNVVEEMRDSDFFDDKEKSKIQKSKKISYREAVVQECWRTNSEEKKIRIRAWQELNERLFFSKKTQKDITESPQVNSSPSSSPKKKIDYDSAPDLESLIKMMDEDEDFQRTLSLQSSSIYQPPGYDNNSNLAALIEILDVVDEKEILLKAEAYRHLGKFSVTIKLLEQHSMTPHFDIWKEALINLAQNKNTEKQIFKNYWKKLQN